MSDGSPILIMDVEDIIRSIDKLLMVARLHKVSKAADGSDFKKRKRILVVDDSITVREVERKLLENNGYEVEIAINGMEAWNAILTNEYNLVITDVDMPRMTGIELLKAARTLDPDLVNVQLDIYWAVRAGVDPLALLAKAPGRVTSVHVKDSLGPPDHRMVNPGQGTIDFGRILAAGAAEIRHAYVEHDEPADGFETARAGYQYLSTLSH